MIPVRRRRRRERIAHPAPARAPAERPPAFAGWPVAGQRAVGEFFRLAPAGAAGRRPSSDFGGAAARRPKWRALSPSPKQYRVLAYLRRVAEEAIVYYRAYGRGYPPGISGRGRNPRRRGIYPCSCWCEKGSERRRSGEEATSSPKNRANSNILPKGITPPSTEQAPWRHCMPGEPERYIAMSSWHRLQRAAPFRFVVKNRFCGICGGMYMCGEGSTSCRE